MQSIIAKFKNSISNFTNNSIIQLIGLIVAVSTVVVSIGYFIVSNYYSNQINELKSNIERLTPSPGELYNIDLTNFFVHRNETLNESIPKTSLFDDNNLFYYSGDKYWTYKKMNPIEFVQFLNEIVPTKEEKEFKDNISHIWHSKYKIDLNHPDYKNLVKKERSEFIADSSPNDYLIVYRKKPNSLFQYIKLTMYNNDISFIKVRDLSKSHKVIDSTSFKELGFKYLSSTFIDQIFNDLYSNLPNSIAFTELNNISMKDNWLFVSTISVFGNKNITNDKTRTVYCFNDWYVLYTELYTYVLEVQTPSFEPVRRGEQFVELNNWLSHFRVIVK